MGKTIQTLNGSLKSSLGYAAAGHSHTLASLGAAASNHNHVVANITDLRIKNVASSITADAPVQTWANANIKNNDIIFGGDYKHSTTDANIVFSSNVGKINMVIDGEYYATEGQHRVYHPGNKPTLTELGAAAASHGTHVTYASATPKANGTAAVGSSSKVAREDHVHPLQATVSGNAGTATKLATARTLTIGSKGKTFDGSANVSWSLSEIGAAAASHTHNYAGSSSAGGAANSAIKLATARAITLKGAITGSGNFDGNANLEITTTRAPYFAGEGKSGSSGYIAFAQLKITSTYTNRPLEFKLICRGKQTPCYVQVQFANTNNTDPDLSSLKYWGTDYGVFAHKTGTSTWLLYHTKSEGYDMVTVVDVNIASQGITITYPGSFITTKPTSNFTNASLGGSIGSASTAGSANTLSTARTLTIGSTGKSFNGSANVSWSLSEIGAAAASHTHSYLPLSGGTMTGDLKFTDVTSTTYPADSKKIMFNGSTDGADIFYRVEAADKGTLVFNLRDDTNTSFAFAYADSIKSRIDTSGNFSGNAATATKATTATTATKASTVNMDRVTGSGVSANYAPGANQLVVREYDSNCTNMPSAHWYHIYTGQGSDSGYNTQLAVGMTTEALYFRNKNANTWNSWKKVSVDGHGTHVSYGGNGSATTVSRSDHYHSTMSTKGTNTIASTTDDTTAKWGAQGNSIHWYTETGKLNNQPSQWGYLLNVGSGSEVHQLWMTQASGDMLHRGGNGSGWSGTWRALLDTSNFKTHVTPSAIGAAAASSVGTLSSLKTSAKGSLVAAINEVFQSGNNAKTKLVEALVAKGASASTSDSWDTLIGKIAGVGQATSGYRSCTVMCQPSGDSTGMLEVATNLGYKPTYLFVMIREVVLDNTYNKLFNFFVSNLQSSTIDINSVTSTIRIGTISTNSFRIHFECPNYSTAYFRDLTWYAFK